MPDHVALHKYATVAALFVATQTDESETSLIAHWIDQLHQATAQLGIRGLSHYGVAAKDYAIIVANSGGSSMKTNPIKLTDDELMALLQART
jgi:alcohol dehydrogenase class IV